MSAIPAALQAEWWQIVTDHQRVDGLCPVCRTPRCWPWAEAFAALVCHDLWRRPLTEATGRDTAAGDIKEKDHAQLDQAEPVRQLRSELR